MCSHGQIGSLLPKVDCAAIDQPLVPHRDAFATPASAAVAPPAAAGAPTCQPLQHHWHAALQQQQQLQCGLKISAAR